MSDSFVCPHCYGHSSYYYHRITPGLVEALLKLRSAVMAYGRNDIDIHREIALTTSEAMNWTKLRFHGLVAKVKVDGETQRGHWLLTSRGADFLSGRLSIPARVKTLNNHVVDRDSVYVTIADILGTVPYFEDILTIEREAIGVNPQISLLEAA